MHKAAFTIKIKICTIFLGSSRNDYSWSEQSSSSEKCQLLGSQIAQHKWSSAWAADKVALKHFAHMLQISDPEYWSLFVNILLWFKQCICLWEQLVFFCYTDLCVEKENNLWFILAVVNYEDLSMLKKYFILWYAFIHSAKKGKDMETCYYLCQLIFFSGHCVFSMVWNAFIWMKLVGKWRNPKNNTRHLQILTFI